MLSRWIFFVALAGWITVAYAQVPGNGSQEAQEPQAHAQQPQSPTVSQVQVTSTKKEERTERKPYQWHELYAPANVPNWLLAVLAGWAGLMALRTLQAIKKQAELMERQNSLMVNKERARVRVELEDFETKQDIGYSVHAKVSIFGSTDAFIDQTEISAHIGEIEKPWITRMVMVPAVIKAGADPVKTVVHVHRGRHILAGDEGIDDVLSGASKLNCRGRVFYSDLFGGKWYFQFAYTLRVLSLDEGKCWVYWTNDDTAEPSGEYEVTKVAKTS